MNKILTPKRQAILEAAKRTFITHGYSGASMEAIADAAPVSKPTLYNHFHSKPDLFAAVIASQCESLISTLNNLPVTSNNPITGLTAIAHAFVELVYAKEALQIYRLIIAEQQQFPELGELVYRSGPEPVLRQMSAYLNQLSNQGTLAISDHETSSQLFLNMLKGDQHFRCLLGLQPGLDEDQRKHLIDSVVALFLKGHGYES
jgi:TetR/AcrR family transcriptional repressor of mexJK operon